MLREESSESPSAQEFGFAVSKLQKEAYVWWRQIPQDPPARRDRPSASIMLALPHITDGAGQVQASMQCQKASRAVYVLFTWVVAAACYR